MYLTRIIRRVHAPMTCLLIVSFVLAGCATRNNTWGIEQVTIPRPEQAWVADDGTLLLAIHVERDWPNRGRTGWHWIIVKPGVARVLTGEAPRDFGDPAKPVNVGWDRDWSDAAMQPSLLEPGLPAPEPTPAGYAGLDAWQVIASDQGHAYRLVRPDDPSRDTPAFVFLPAYKDSKTTLRSISEVTTQIVLIPIFIVGFAAIMTWWVLTGMRQSPI